MAESPPGAALAAAPVSWASLFEVDPANKMTYRPPQKMNDGFRLPREVKKRGEERWKDCLIAQFVGSVPKPAALQQWATSLWGRDGVVRVSKFGPRLMVFQFPSAATGKWVFKSGPWHFQGNPVYFRKWFPGIQPVTPAIETPPIWVKLWGIPLEYHSFEGHEWIASTIGAPLWMDHTTRVGAQLGYAKVCVDLAADCGFPGKVRLYPDDDPSFEIEIEYLNKPLVCDRCGIYGHDCDWLAKSGKKWIPKAKVTKENTEAVLISGVDKVVDGKDKGKGVDLGSEMVISVGSAAEGSSQSGNGLILVGSGAAIEGNSNLTSPVVGGPVGSFVAAVKGSSAPSESSVSTQSSPEGRLDNQITPARNEVNPWITVIGNSAKKKPPVPPAKKGGKGGKKK
ncbi:unnamed protein product [Linum trigynum]|uniref:DUF4283 domain-containing protein n=1 Tax=Linum trigynum TaxID=586398 RepID=A0AAV2CL82_9ROSI